MAVRSFTLDREFEDLATALGAFGSSEQVGQGGGVQNLRGRLTHVAHQQPYAARLLVAALFALSICGLARARERRDRTFEGPQYLPNEDLGGRLGEEISAATAFAAIEKPVVLHFQEDQ